MELIEAEAFFVGGVFLCTAFGTAALCLMEWLKSVWPSVIVLCLFVWGWPFHLAFEKMLSVFEAETILRYGMFETFAAFSQNIEEGKLFAGHFRLMRLDNRIWRLRVFGETEAVAAGGGFL